MKRAGMEGAETMLWVREIALLAQQLDVVLRPLLAGQLGRVTVGLDPGQHVLVTQVHAPLAHGAVHSTREDGMAARRKYGPQEVADTGGFLLGLCLDADANVYACDLGRKAVIKISQEAKVSVYSDGAPNRNMVAPNYPAFDRAGNLFISDSGNWDQGDGCIFCIRPGGRTEVATRKSLLFPNGLAFHPDGTELYLVLSNLPGVGKVVVDENARVGPVEIVVKMERAIPDGLAFDVEGNLYISCYTPDRIYRLTPQGDLTPLVEDWRSVILSSPTNIAFCGRDLSTLVVASLSRWHLAKAEMPIPGSPLFYPGLDKYDEAIS